MFQKKNQENKFKKRHIKGLLENKIRNLENKKKQICLDILMLRK